MRTLPHHAVALETLEPRAMLSGDHPSLAELPSATPITLEEDLNQLLATGEIGGIIGQIGDDDVFSFVAPNDGEATIRVRQDPSRGGDGFLFAPSIRLFNNEGHPVTIEVDGWDGVAAIPPAQVDLVGGEEYFVNIRAGSRSDTNDWDLMGGYTLSFVMTIPEGGSVPSNDPLPLDIDEVTGRGHTVGYLRHANDFDLYQFAADADGEVNFTIITPGSDLVASFEITDANGVPVAGGLGNEQQINASFHATAFQLYLARVSVHDAAAPGAQRGAYELDVIAPVPGGVEGVPADQELSEIEMARAVSLPVELLSGLASVTDRISAAEDTDVFTIRALRSGTATVVLERASIEPFESVLDVFTGRFTRVAFDAVGGQAWIGRVAFEVVEGEEYFIRIRGRNAYIGDYTLKTLVPLQEYVVMYPEGYSTGTIDEYVPLVNANAFDVSYTIIARYETGERDQVIATGVVPASSRGGVTITSQRAPGQSLVRTDTPYALEVRSTGLLGATLSHYDFGVTTGENFTNKRSTVWTFAEARRDPDRYRDFLVFYNPNPSAAVFRISLVYDDGEVVNFTREVEAFRRSGVNFTTDDAITRDGVFSIRVDADQPMIAALSSYDYVDQRGFGLLGDADGGDREAVVPILSGDASSALSLAVYNATSMPADVTLTSTVLVPQAAEVVRVFTIDPGERRTLTAADLGFGGSIAGLAGLRYASSVPISVMASEYHTGDGDSTAAAAHAAHTSIIADAFVNPAGAGSTYRELLSVYNPWGTTTQVTVSLLREGGGVLDTLNLSVAPGAFVFTRVDQMPGVMAQTQPVAFSIRIEGSAPIVAGFMHYDLFLDGGWGTLATPLGVTTSLESI